MNLDTLEKKIGLEIPSDYIQFRDDKLYQESEIFFKIDNWVFWDLNSAIDETIKLRENKSITEKDFAFAISEDNQILFYQSSNKSSTKIMHLDEGNDIIFYAFSLSEFNNFDKTQHLIEEIETVGFENQDLTEINNCPGSLFNYAFELKTSEYDENFSHQRNQKAIELLFEVAEKGQPEAADEIANYYYYQDKVDNNKVIEWREKAINLGSKESIYELADFIIDEKVEDIDKAISLLESLLHEQWYKERAMLKLSRIYMRGTGNRIDYEKGIKYVTMCAEENNYNALSDLAFYYYKGMGIEKNVLKAYDLLVKAESKIIEKTGSGMWGDLIKKIEQELD